MIHTFVKGEPDWVDPLNANFQEVATTAGSAIPASEKGAIGGVATLDSAGKLAQMPTAEDVGAAPEAQFGAITLTATTQFKEAKIKVARAGKMVAINTTPITGYARPSSGGYPVMCTLPQGYRPSSTVDVLLPISGGGYANVMVGTDGNVTVGVLSDATAVNLRVTLNYVL